MTSAMDLSALTVEEAGDFVSEKLGLPTLAHLFRDQDVDGSVLLQLETSTIQQFLPSITLGQCVKFFSKLKKYQDDQTSQPPSTLPRDESVIDLSTDTLRLSLSPSPPSPPPAIHTVTDPAYQQTAIELPSSLPCPERSPSPLPHMPARSSNPASPSQRTPSPASLSASTTPNKPMPKEFPIRRVHFTPNGNRMIQTGEVTISGKTSITDGVCAEMLNFSMADGYVDRTIKENAATALVSMYPKLTLGMSIVGAKKAWQKSFTQKLINWRKRNKIQDPKMAEMKEKHTHPKPMASVEMNSLRKRKVISDVELTEDEVIDHEIIKQSMQREMMKKGRSRNIRTLQAETEQTYPLRRKSILVDAPHVKDFLRDWPSLRVEPIMLKEFTLVTPDVAAFEVFNTALNSILSQLVNETRRKACTYPKSHPLAKLVAQVPWVENTNPEFDTDLNIIGATTGLAYILPTTAKKEGEAQQYLVDVCPSDTTIDEVREAVRDRHQPFVMVYGRVSEITKILVYVDNEPVITCSSMSKALYVMLAYYFVMNVEYARPVSAVLEFLQVTCLGLPIRKQQTRVRELIHKLNL